MLEDVLYLGQDYLAGEIYGILGFVYTCLTFRIEECSDFYVELSCYYMDIYSVK